MKICQIAFIGNNIEWILKGLLIYSTHKLLIISTKDSEYIKKTEEIKTRLTDPKFELVPVEIMEIFIEIGNPAEFVKALKKIIVENYKDGYKIDINATTGLRVWQILAYSI